MTPVISENTPNYKHIIIMKNRLVKLLASSVLALVFVTGASTSALASTKSYPLKTCVVSGNTLGSMGKPVTKVHQGQEVKFCCKPCVKKFDANPAKYVSKVSR